MTAGDGGGRPPDGGQQRHREHDRQEQQRLRSGGHPVQRAVARAVEGQHREARLVLGDDPSSGAPTARHPALREQHDDVAAGGQVEVVGDEHEPVARVSAKRWSAIRRAVAGVEVGGRLVGDDEFRPADEGSAERQQLLLAAGEFVRGAVGELGQPEFARAPRRPAAFSSAARSRSGRSENATSSATVGMTICASGLLNTIADARSQGRALAHRVETQDAAPVRCSPG